MQNETVKRKKRIAVVSKRRSVCDFLRLEAESVGCYVSVSPAPPPMLDSYDVVIVDTECGCELPNGGENIYKILTDGQPIEDKSFYWPVPVTEIRSIYEGVAADSERTSREPDHPIIYLTDGDVKAAVYNGKRVALSEGEWRVLARLGESEGEPVSREELRGLFGANDGNITDVYVCHLRKKLEDPHGARMIGTVRGKGYALYARIVK